jgi:Family of unknown function (DUF6288)/HEAT repeats
MKNMRLRAIGIFVCLLAVGPLWSAERDAEGASAAALSDATDAEGKAYVPKRPDKMPDLTKGDPLPAPGKDGVILWNMGVTGIIGVKNGGNAGDQVQVVSIYPGSPAEGKILPGDVLLGVAGKRFEVGGDINRMAGEAIIKAEEEAGKGILRLHLWRDRNWVKRAAPKDVFGVDIDQLFKEAATSENDIYEWQGEAEQKASVTKMAFDKFPIDGVMTNITLQLRVIGTYSETSPWDCPVVQKVREEAWKLLAADAMAGKKKKRGGIDWPTVLALVASGKPEYVQLAKEWVHTQSLETNMNAQVTIAPAGMQSWHHGFTGLEMAIYYDATKDPFVLPEVRKWAIRAAMGQTGGGSWGHTFSYPEVNGGILHGRAPGYGGMNNAGSRCFFLLTLARKAGIKDPELDAAIWRASHFFSTYIDKGCIPYGDHGPANSDDSNGKNYGVAYAFYTLGRKYEGQYFSMCSAHAAFSRRGGHASPTLWYYTPLSANIAGPRATQASMRNMRPFYTLSRRHDGSFVFLGEQGPGIGGKGMRNSTATLALHLSAPLQQLTITGKDADEKFWLNDKELKELLVSARGQVGDKALLEKIGKPWNERDSQELIEMLGHFYPGMRKNIAKELAKRFTSGEKAILEKVLPLLASPNARERQGACLTLSACGDDILLASLSKVASLLDDPAEFVRMSAVDAISQVTTPGDLSKEELLLKAASIDYPTMSTDIANVRTAVKGGLLTDKKSAAGSKSKFLTDPFSSGHDKELVRLALERLVTGDPGGVAPSSWSQQTVVELAGPILFIAEELQLMDKMFGGSRLSQGRAILAKYGYREAVESTAVNLVKRSNLDRGMRKNVQFAHGGAAITYNVLNPDVVLKQPGAYRAYLPQMRQWLQDDPLAAPTGMGSDWVVYNTELNVLISKVEEDTKTYDAPSLAEEAIKSFEKDLASKGSPAEKIKVCRDVLKDTTRKDFFRQIGAMNQLVAMVGAEAISDMIPYVAADQRRVRENACALMTGLAKGGASVRVAECFSKAEGPTAAALLLALVDSGAQNALPLVRSALKHKDDCVRKVAVQSMMGLEGEKALQDVFAFMVTASGVQELWGCELALLSRKGAPAFAKQVQDGAMAMMPKASVQQRRSLAFVLGQLGGEACLTFLEKAAVEAVNDEDLDGIIEAISYSPDREADKTLLTLANLNKKTLAAVYVHAVRRMVGPNGVGDVTDTQRMDFAEPMLKLKPDASLINYLGKIHTGRALKALYEVMKKSNTDLAALSIINAAGNMEKKPESERAIAAEVLTSVIEYIEVTKLRGGYAAHSMKEDNYAGWKTTQAMAGQALLRVHKPQDAPIPVFNDKDLDL